MYPPFQPEQLSQNIIKLPQFDDIFETTVHTHTITNSDFLTKQNRGMTEIVLSVRRVTLACFGVRHFMLVLLMRCSR